MIELTIDRLTNGGRGCGRYDGKTVFVPLTAPGDTVRCRIVTAKKRYAEAELVEVLSTAADRIAPVCAYFGDCGGCQWQFLPYAAQLDAKVQIFTELLTRQAGIADVPLCAPLSAPDPWHYRGRAQFKCHATAAGLVIGFYRRNSHHVVAIDTCPILADRLNQALAFLRQHLPSAPAARQISQIDVQVGADGRLRAMLIFQGEAPDRLLSFLAPLFAAEKIALAIQYGHKKALQVAADEDDLFISVAEPPLALRYRAGGFVQVNQAQNRQLVAQVLRDAGDLRGRRVLDLYCGIGNFSLPLARWAGQVVGVEEYGPAIADAQRNATQARLDNCSFHARDAVGAATALWGDGFDLVLLDPPRSGAAEVVAELVRLCPPRIIYVSCDPATLARDLKVLIEGGYRLVATRVVDMFPQTFHIESISLLERVA